MKYKSCNIYTCIIIIIVTLISCNKNNTYNSNIYGLTTSVKDQKTPNRIWVEPKIIGADTISSGSNYSLFNPTGVRIKEDGLIYVWDEGSFTYKSFNQEGEYVASYGNGMGDGPGQFQRASDLGVWQDSVYVVDDRSRRVSYFSKDGSFVRSKRYDGPIYQMDWASDSTRYVTHMTFASSIFLKIIPPSKEASTIPIPLSSDVSPIVFDGFLHTTRERAVYIPFYFPVVITFSPENTVGTAYPTPDYNRVPFPEARTQGSETTKTVYPPKTKVNGFSTLTDGIISVPIRGGVVGDTLAFDVYNAREFRYLHSAKFPILDATGKYSPSNGLLSIRRDTTVEIYNIDNE